MQNKINFMNGTVYVTSDINLVMMEADKPTSKIIYMDDDVIDPLKGRENVIISGIFLPDYNAICEFENGNIDGAIRIYDNHLTKYFSKSMPSILASLAFFNVNFLIYIPNHIYGLASYIEEFMHKRYGIIAGSFNKPYVFDYAFNDYCIGLLYLSGVIGYIETLNSSTPGGFANNIEVVKKLIIDIDPALPSNTYPDYVRYFTEYQGMLYESEMPLRPAIAAIQVQDTETGLLC